MKKTFCLATLVCLITISFAFIKDDKPKYENLKVLPKNTTKQEMDSVMKHFSQSLGVRCTYCHVRSNDDQKNFNFASDENDKKAVARYMMRMMNKINKKYFKDEDESHKNLIGAVSCFTCHNGKEEPGNKPPPPQPKQ